MPGQSRLMARTLAAAVAHVSSPGETDYARRASSPLRQGAYRDPASRCRRPGVEHMVVDLIEDFHVPPAFLAGFRFDGSGLAFHRVVGDAAGRAAKHALDADHVPHRAAKRAGAKPAVVRSRPAHNGTRHRRAAADGAHAVSDGLQMFGRKLRREPGEVDLEASQHESALGHIFYGRIPECLAHGRWQPANRCRGHAPNCGRCLHRHSRIAQALQKPA